MQGLSPKAERVFETVSTLSILSSFVLVGGTALSIQITHRESEDLDFCRWVPDTSPSNWVEFERLTIELENCFPYVKDNVLGYAQAMFFVSHDKKDSQNVVKIEFFNEMAGLKPVEEPYLLKGNIRIATIPQIGVMKIKTIFQRHLYRDYYDLYCLIKDGHIKPEELIPLAIKYKNDLSEANIVQKLLGHEQFAEEEDFQLLNPKYLLSSKEIGDTVLGGQFKVVEGNWQPTYLVMIEFPSYEKANAWYHSKEYEQVKAIRLEAAMGNGVIFEGM